MLIPTDRGLICPDRTCNELHYYEPKDALNSYGQCLVVSGETAKPCLKAIGFREETEFWEKTRFLNLAVFMALVSRTL